MKRITKGAALVAATCLALAVVPRLAKSADHQDGPAVKAEQAADINDLYSWVDGSNVVFALTVYPDAPATALFSDKVQYVIHTTSADKFGGTETSKDIICTFAGTAAPQTASCWVGATDDFVMGAADTATGIKSADSKLQVFAGRRKDPFFFNLDGFKDTVLTVQNAVDAGVVNEFDAGCPVVDGGTSSVLVTKLQTTNGGAAVDHFKDFNTLAIVVSVDKSLISSDDKPIVSAWASTHKAQ